MKGNLGYKCNTHDWDYEMGNCPACQEPWNYRNSESATTRDIKATTEYLLNNWALLDHHVFVRIRDILNRVTRLESALKQNCYCNGMVDQNGNPLNYLKNSGYCENCKVLNEN